MTVSDLTPNERYVFAVAAYTSEGKLIGGGVGETTKPILASHALPVLMTWALISQVGYPCVYIFSLLPLSRLFSVFILAAPSYDLFFLPISLHRLIDIKSRIYIKFLIFF